jgi:hypothetical protein
VIELYVRIEYPKIQCFDDNGNFAVGYEIHTYKVGTATAQTTYSEWTLTTPNSNPVILDARGEADIFTGLPVKLIFCAPGSGSTIWTCDYVGQEQQANYVTGSATPVTANNNYVVDTTPPVTALAANFQLTLLPDIDNADTLVPTGDDVDIFTGTGNDDLTAFGPYVGSTAGSVYTVQIDSVAKPIDSYVKALLHCEGTTTSFVDSSAGGKAVTAHGDVTQNDAQFKFGTKSALFDGVGDYISLADHADWYLSTEDFTIEGWWRFSAVASGTFWGQNTDANSHTYFDYNHAGPNIRFYAKRNTAVMANYNFTWSPTIDTWHHIALVRSGTNLYLFIDGDLKTWTTTTVAINGNRIQDCTGVLTIGYATVSGTYFAGYMDEFCWSLGIARYTADFDVPTQAYSDDPTDTFKWKKDGGAWTTGVALTGALQTLSEGVRVLFASTSSHTFEDLWAITVMTPARVNLDSLGNLIVYKNKGGTIVALDGGDMKADYPAQLILNSTATAWLLINPASPVYDTTTIQATRYRRNISSAYVMVAADEGYELSCTGTFTITLLACPIFSNNFCYIKNVGTGLITIDAGTYAIWGKGETTYVLYPGAAIQLLTNGIDWHILAEQKGYRVFIAENVDEVEITGLDPEKKYQMIVELIGNNADAYHRIVFNDDDGNHYDCTTGTFGDAVSAGAGASGVSAIWVSAYTTYTVDDAYPIYAIINFSATPADQTYVTVMGQSMYRYKTGPLFVTNIFAGRYDGAAALTSVRYYANDGEFTGTIHLYEVGNI